MFYKFLLTNNSNYTYSFDKKIEISGYTLYFDPKSIQNFENCHVFIDGYVLPRNTCNEFHLGLTQHEIIYKLYKNYGVEFIQYIKGSFCIIILESVSIKIFNDHLGINKFFYSQNQKHFSVSNSYKLIAENIDIRKVNSNAIIIKSLLNREVNSETIISEICWSKPATAVLLINGKIEFSNYWKPEVLINIKARDFDYKYFADLIKQNIDNYTNYLHPAMNSITLTGGKDSRTALTALLAKGIKPLGITYGNPDSKDAVFAKLMAKNAGIDHEVVNPEKSIEWFDEMTSEIINLDNPLLNIHRGHRYLALLRIQQLLGKDTAYYGGYMGGELLMGIFYDNLIFTDFLTNSWEDGFSPESIPGRLKANFIREEAIDIESVIKTLGTLRALDGTLTKKMKQFQGLFEIGILHHSQDLQIAMHVIKYPIPFFLDIELLEALFASKHNFLFRNSNSKNLFERHKLFKFNLTIQHLLYPGLDTVPFAKKGSYNTKEFLKGPIYWSLARVLNHLTQKQKYPPPFTYNQAYKAFITKSLSEIMLDKDSSIHEIYNVELAINTLDKLDDYRAENIWHRFSNIVMHYKQIKKYTT